MRRTAILVGRELMDGAEGRGDERGQGEELHGGPGEGGLTADAADVRTPKADAENFLVTEVSRTQLTQLPK